MKTFETDVGKLNRQVEALQTQAIPLGLARVCVDCEVIHAGQICPKCGGGAASVPLPWGRKGGERPWEKTT